MTLSAVGSGLKIYRMTGCLIFGYKKKNSENYTLL